MLSKIFNFIKTYQSDVVLSIGVALITITSYNLGKISAYKSIKSPITADETGNAQNIVRHEIGERGEEQTSTRKTSIQRDQSVVASKKSQSKLYHFTWCPGAAKIANQNKITFPNEAAAIAAGFKLASNCTK